MYLVGDLITSVKIKMMEIKVLTRILNYISEYLKLIHKIYDSKVRLRYEF